MSSWTLQSNTGTYEWRSVCFGNGIYIGVDGGSNGRVLRSLDGNAWTTSASGITTAGWFGVCYGNPSGNPKFVAVGSNYIMTSSDGVSWAGKNTGIISGMYWSSVVYGNGLYVACSQSSNSNSSIMYSSDGDTWTRADATNSSGIVLRSITYGGGKFVAVGQTSTRIIYSSNGNTWSKATSVPLVDWMGVAYGAGTFVTVAYNGAGSATQQVMTSTDGNIWISKTAPNNANWSGVAFGNGQFTASADGASNVMVSTNGNTWTSQSLPAAGSWYTITYGNGLFIIAGGGGSVRVNRVVPISTLSINNFTVTYQTPPFSIIPNIVTTNYEAPTYTYTVINTTSPNVAVIIAGNLITGNVGTANIQVTQSATTNFAVISANTMVTVTQLQSNIRYTLPSNIKYNDLSFNLLANSNVNGATILYTSSNTIVANVTSTGNVIVGNAGTANINLTIQGTTNYSTVSANIIVTVNKLQSNILVPTSFTQTYGNTTIFNVNATTNNQETPILYTSINPLIANVDSYGNIRIGNAGNTRVQLTQGNTTNYSMFTANTTIFVNPATPTLTIPNFNATYQSPSFSILPNILTNNPEGPIYTYQVLNSTSPNVANIVAGTLTIGNAGTANIAIIQSATTNYTQITANTTVTVSQLQSNLNYTVPSNIKYKDLSFNLRANTNVNGATIIYSALNPLIANVTSTGNVIVGNAGTANINLTIVGTNNYTGISSNILITVNKIDATLGYPNSSYTKNYKDLSFNLNANTTNTDSNIILYTTDNPIVANVNTTGNVTIGNAGTASITLTQAATANYNSVSANILITVNKIQANLGYPNSSYTKNYKDQSFNLNANTTNTDSTTILYTTDNPIVANVNTTGNVTIGNVGIAKITLTGSATANYNSVTANILITVNKIEANLGYPNSSYTKNYKDLSFNLNANTTNTDSTTILYITDNPVVANVNTTGNVTIGNAGTANITLTGSATANYNSVTSNILITVNKIEANLGYPNSSYTKNYKDQSFNLNANTTNTDSNVILYTTDNPIVANVNATGNVTIGNAGTASITLTQAATANYNSVTANILITVNKIQANLGYPNSSYTKNYKDQSFNLNANTTNTDSNIILYTTDNPIVANVNTTGNVTIGNTGTANITLTRAATTNYNSVSANILITVNKIEANLGYPNSSYTKNYKDQSFNLNANTTNTDSNIILYTTDNPIVANVNTTGNVTIGNAGTASITLTRAATTNYNSVSANILITVNKIQANLGYPNSSYTKNYKDLSFNLNANTTNTDSNIILYTTDNPIVANVNTTGNVTIGNAGIANIILTRAATTNYNSVTANILITVNKIQANLGYPNSSYTKNYKDISFNLNANTTNTDSTTILYTTDNPIVANVNTTGNVTIGNVGIAKITLTGTATTNYNSVTANITINVNKIQANLGYPNSSYTKNYLDASFQLNANTTNTDSTQILYSTDNSSVAIVNTTGNVTIGNAGIANIILNGNATANYYAVTSNILITVNKIQAILNYPAYSGIIKNYRDLSFNLNVNTTNKDSSQILYAIDNTYVATVDINGNVIIGNMGIANITLKGNGTTNYFPVTSNIQLTINSLQASLQFPYSSYTKNYLDPSFNLNVTTTNTDSSQILYRTDNANVATVDISGNVILGNVGTANIILTGNASANYNSVTANILITVNKIEANIGYPNSSYTKNYKDQSFNLNANTTNTDSTQILYSTDNTSVAIVNTTGNVTIGNAGTANITLLGNATTNYKSVSANILITVNPIQANLGYPNSSYTKNYLDQSFQLDANTTNTDSTEIVYTTDNPIVANVNTTGNVVIGNAGTANITLRGNATTNYNSVTANILITVNPIQANLGYPYSSYTKKYLDPPFQLDANTTNTDSTQILYSTDNTNVAIVNTTGNVIIGNAGTANIQISGNATTNYNSVTANIVITVNKIQAILGYPNASYTKNYLDESFQLNANTTNTDSTEILYSTDNSSVAVVNTTGNVTIGNAGTSNITLTGNATTNYNSVTANIAIIVNKIQANLGYPYSSYTKNYLDPSFNLNANTTNTDSTQLLYSTDNLNVAIVNSNGNVIIGNAGTANITLTGNATTNYYPVSANILINVNPIEANLVYSYSSYTKNYLDPSFNLNANTTNTDSPQIIYSTDNPIVAIVDTMGNITIGNTGTANISLIGNATTNYYPVSANILINVNPIQANLVYSYSSYTKNYLDPSFNLNVNTTNTDSPQIIYSTDNPIVAIVDTMGNITIGNTGTANITLIGNQTINYYPVSANILINVNPIQANLVYPYSSYTKNYKDLSFNLNANTTNTDNTEIIYSTDNPIVAIVDTMGNITIGNAGIANIILTGNATTNYRSITANIQININPLQANLEYPYSIYTKTYKDPSFPLNANTTNTDSIEILYSTDNPDVAIVDTTGNVTIGNTGTANIILTGNATPNYTSTTANIRINVSLAQVNLVYPYSSYTKNYKDPSFPLNANTNNTDNNQILYSTDNPGVAIVDTTGNVTIGNAGTANIILTGNATINYSSVTANILIVVNKLQANLGYPYSSYTKNYKDLSFNLNANTTNTDSTAILYSTDNEFVANVNASGNVTIGNAGTANITLTGNETTNYYPVSANILVTVNRLQANIFYPYSIYNETYKGTKFNLNAYSNNIENSQILYSTSNPIVANVDTRGNITIGNAGTTNITLTQNRTTNYNEITANIIINVARLESYITVVPVYVRKYLDNSFNLKPRTNNTEIPIQYISQNPTIADVDIYGNVIIGNTGNTRITLVLGNTNNYLSTTAITNIYVNKRSSNITVDSSFTRTYGTITPFNVNANKTNPETPIQYTSLNTGVATVDSYGNIIVGNVGNATIQLYQPETVNYFAANSNTVIYVNKKLPQLTIDSSFIRIYQSPSFDLTPYINTTNTDANRVIQYSTSNDNIATVVDGIVTIREVGSAIITIKQLQTQNFMEVTTSTIIYVLKKQTNIIALPSITTINGTPPFGLNVRTNNLETPIIYSSSNTEIATITNGMIIIKNVGTTIITMRQENSTNFLGASTTTIIYVKEKPPYKIPTATSLSNQFAYGVKAGNYTIKDKTAYPVRYTPVFSKITGEQKQRRSKFG